MSPSPSVTPVRSVRALAREGARDALRRWRADLVRERETKIKARDERRRARAELLASRAAWAERDRLARVAARRRAKLERLKDKVLYNHAPPG